jgi:hypothetical protein
MALVLADRVRETTTTTGTGTVTLAGAVTGFQSFSAVGDGNTTYYTIAGQGTAEWEVGIGTYTSSGTTLSRTTVLSSSNSGSLVNFSAGTKDVFVTYPAGKSVNQDASNNVGIGTTSPGTFKLAVVGGRIQLSGGTSSQEGVAIQRASGYASITGINNDNNAFNALAFYTGATEAMRITTAGGVSFGTTGTAYGTSGQVLTSAGNAPPTWTTLTKAIKSLSLYAFNGTVSATSGAFTASVTGLLTGSTFTATGTGTATSSGTTLTVSAVSSGAFGVGQTVTFPAAFTGTATSSGTTLTIATATAGVVDVGTVLNTNASFTASRATTIMTVTAVASGGIHVGMVVSTLGTVNSFGTGTGGVGTYNMSASGTVVSGARTGTGTATITALGTGTGGTGTYTTNRTYTYGTASAVSYNSGAAPTRTISTLGTGIGGAGTYTLSSAITAATAVAITGSALTYTVTSGTETGTTGTLTPAYTIASQTVTSNSGTWTAPTGVTSVRVTLIGGGGGGGTDLACNYPAGGYGGGACGVYTVSGGTAYSYSVGLGGNGSGNASGGGASGGTTSFSSLISATGGGGATSTVAGTNGIGSNGTIRNVQTVIQTVYYGFYGCSTTSTAVVFNALSSPGALYSAGFGGTSSNVSVSTTAGLAGVSGAILLEWNE